MAQEFVEVLESTGAGVSVSNTAVLTSIYSKTILGGLLGTNNRLRWQMQGVIDFAAQNDNCTFYMYYAGSTVASCIAQNAAGGARSNVGIRVNAELGADNSINSQFGTVHSYIGLPRSEDGSTPVGFGTVGEASGGDEDFEIKVKWNSASASNTLQNAHSTLELISFTEDETAEDLDEPTAYIFVDSKLNKLRYDLRKYVYFYAPLEHELDFYGYGEATFVRASTSTATWRDGASHDVAVNEARFEYDGDTVKGLKITTASETLTFPTANALHDSNSLCWLENGIYKSTVRGDTNPVNASGVVTGFTNTYLTQMVKFNKTITAAEDVEVETAITS